MTRKLKQYDDDDGRVICDMDVDGMRWHDKRLHDEKPATPAASVAQGEQMTKSEARRYTFSAVLAGLTVALIFSAVWVLFILFCTKVWFR
ncbi:MAG: hypothetical protein ABFD05_01710 [Anaerolineaceae bacterium]